MLRRWRGRGDNDAAVAAATAAITSSANKTESESAYHTAVFGLAGGRKAEPTKKLEQAAAVLRSRVESLEQRAADQRKMAVQLSKSGQKAQALRVSKKAKAVEALVAMCARSETSDRGMEQAGRALRKLGHG